jgi:hypothetical protein
VEVGLPAEEVARFADTLSTAEYARHERDYKVAVHEVVSRLLAPEAMQSAAFPHLLSGLAERRLDLGELGFDAADVARIGVALEPFRTVTDAVIQLAGGRFAANNLVWIQPAVELGLGDDLRATFVLLLDEKRVLADRVDGFRDAIYAVEERSKSAGGFAENWQLGKPSLGFVAALLAAVDPQQFTFYHAGKLRFSYEELVGRWPVGGQGHALCDLARVRARGAHGSAPPGRAGPGFDRRSELPMAARAGGHGRAARRGIAARPKWLPILVGESGVVVCP